MRTIGLLALLIILNFPCMAGATDSVFESGPGKTHLLELYTSEGCSSCPPAEAWMSKLRQESGVWHDFVPVAFHVDYWDRLGWRDRFASKEWTARQSAYAAQWNAPSVYTPGFVLDGKESAAQLPPKSSEQVGTLRLKTDGHEASVGFVPLKNTGSDREIYLATLGFALASDVAAGENAGRKLRHDFVILSLQKSPLNSESAEVKFKLDQARGEKIGAVAAWITNAGDPTPIQATGGWLP